MAFTNKFGVFQAQVEESGPEVVAPVAKKQAEKQGGGHGKEKKI
jgi:hypothetical protein